MPTVQYAGKCKTYIPQSVNYNYISEELRTLQQQILWLDV